MTTTTDALADEVRARFDRLGLPSWPDPRPHRPPLEEEYSRVTNPGRYVVVPARARLWAEVLRDVLGARVERVPPWQQAFDRGARVTPVRAGTLPLLLLEREVRDRSDAQPLPVLTIAVDRPDVVVEQQPDCGCDACDSGSADVLEVVDRTICQVVGGPFVVLRGAGWGVEWGPDHQRGHSDGGRRYDHEAMMRLCRRLADGEDVLPPAGVEAFVGRSWLD